MSKIIDFSSKIEEVYFDSVISTIRSELEKEKISKAHLREMQQKLESLSAKLNKNLQRQVHATKAALDRILTLQEEVYSLMHLCHTKSLNSKVQKLSDSALRLQEGSLGQDLSKKICKVRRDIVELNKNHALSLENRKLIHLATKHLDVLDGKTPSIKFSFTKEETLLEDPIELSLDLYEMAGNIYKLDIGNAFMLFYSFPEYTKKRLKRLFEENGYKFEDLKSCNQLSSYKELQYFFIQALIGYSHMLLYGDYHILTHKEIEELFYDMDMTLSGEIVADL